MAHTSFFADVTYYIVNVQTPHLMYGVMLLESKDEHLKCILFQRDFA